MTGPSYASLAVGAGKQAALTIDRYLRGEPLREEVKKPPVVGYEELNLEDIPPLPRARGPILEAATRVCGFAEVEGPFTPAFAVGEAERCFSCNPFSERCIVSFNCPAMIRDTNGRSSIIGSLCNGCGFCAALCPHKAIVKGGHSHDSSAGGPTQCDDLRSRRSGKRSRRESGRRGPPKEGLFCDGGGQLRRGPEGGRGMQQCQGFLSNNDRTSSRRVKPT